MEKHFNDIAVIRIIALVIFLLTVVLDEDSDASTTFYIHRSASKKYFIIKRELPGIHSAGLKTTYTTCIDCNAAGKYLPIDNAPKLNDIKHYLTTQTPSENPFIDKSRKMGIPAIHAPPDADNTENSIYQSIQSKTNLTSIATSSNQIDRKSVV